MHPKIDAHQSLPLTKITGPIGDWELDDAAAVFTLVISQVGTGGWATGIGKERRIQGSEGQDRSEQVDC
jgi:hypothetical protein